MAKLLEGKPIAEKIKEEIKQQVQLFKEKAGFSQYSGGRKCRCRGLCKIAEEDRRGFRHRISIP